MGPLGAEKNLESHLHAPVSPVEFGAALLFNATLFQFFEWSIFSIFSSVSVESSFLHPEVKVLSSSMDFGIMFTSSTDSSSLRPHSVSSSFRSFLALSDGTFENLVV